MSENTGAEQWSHEALVAADKAHGWHPFTQMAEWCAPEYDPLLLVSGEGAMVRDTLGREYIDGNSSIWTNLHGHNHPRLNAALQRQIGKIAHTSFLGFGNPPTAQLAQELVELWPPNTLTRVFFSDDGSTAVEVALKMAAQYWQLFGEPQRTKFVAFSGAYHGDTFGASSLGGIGAFHERFAAWQFPVLRAEGLDDLASTNPQGVIAVIIEPLIQGANQMRLWPAGMLRALRDWCDTHGVLLILDEVMTAFGRTGTMFACEQENVIPDLVAVAKGLTGGYLPLAATFASEQIFQAFLGGPERTLYYGHSYTGNQLACAVALENLSIFREERVLEGLQGKIVFLRKLLEEELQPVPAVYEIRQCGFIVGIELRQESGERFASELRVGSKVCMAAREFGLLTRPILDTVVLMLPYCVTEDEIRRAVGALRKGVGDVLAQDGVSTLAQGASVSRPTRSLQNLVYLNTREDVIHTGSKIPHWQQKGACYFVTFRVADALPLSYLQDLERRRDSWLRSHPEPHTEIDQKEYHQKFVIPVDRSLDEGLGSCPLKTREMRDIVADTLAYFEGGRIVMHSYVLMPNHVHALFVLNSEWKLEEVLRSWKGFSARACNKLTGSTGSFWQRDYFDRLIRDQNHLVNCARYIRSNPQKAKLLPSEYILWESSMMLDVLA